MRDALRLSAMFHKSGDVFYPTPTPAPPPEEEGNHPVPPPSRGRSGGGWVICRINVEWHRIYEKDYLGAALSAPRRLISSGFGISGTLSAKSNLVSRTSHWYRFEKSLFMSQILRPHKRQNPDVTEFELCPPPPAVLRTSLIHSGINPCSGKDRKEREVCA